jgi:hypothetical protein
VHIVFGLLGCVSESDISGHFHSGQTYDEAAVEGLEIQGYQKGRVEQQRQMSLRGHSQRVRSHAFWPE